MADKNVKLKDGQDTLYPQTKIGNIINDDGSTYKIPPATETKIGGVKAKSFTDKPKEAYVLESVYLDGNNTAKVHTKEITIISNPSNLIFSGGVIDTSKYDKPKSIKITLHCDGVSIPPYIISFGNYYSNEYLTNNSKDLDNFKGYSTAFKYRDNVAQGILYCEINFHYDINGKSQITISNGLFYQFSDGKTTKVTENTDIDVFNLTLVY